MSVRTICRSGAALALALACLAAGPAWSADDAGPSGTVAKFERAAPPKPTPDLRWTGPDSSEISLATYKGKLVLLNLWATWCAPCIKELPSLQRLQAKLGDAPFALIALSIDRNAPGAEKARAMLKRLRLDALGFHHDGEGRVFRALGITVMPTTVLFDAEGREVGRLPGPAEWDAPEAEALVKSFIPQR